MQRNEKNHLKPHIFFANPVSVLYDTDMNTIEYENYREEKEHGSPLFPYVTYLCSIPLDFSEVPVHWHDEVEIIYVKKGMGTVYVNLKSFTVKGPAIVLILPGCLHGIRQYGEDSMEYENIIFHPNLLYGTKSDFVSREFVEPVLSGAYDIPAVLTPKMPQYRQIAAPIDACDEICRQKPKGFQLFVKGQLFQLLYALISCFRGTAPGRKNQKDLERIKPVLKYVERHYPEKIPVSDIAGELGVSEAHFMRFFKEIMEMSFVTYLNHYRLTMAARLLRISGDSILEISQETGFQNLSNFNRAFKKKYGQTPSDYRKGNGRDTEVQKDGGR